MFPNSRRPDKKTIFEKQWPAKVLFHWLVYCAGGVVTLYSSSRSVAVIRTPNVSTMTCCPITTRSSGLSSTTAMSLQFVSNSNCRSSSTWLVLFSFYLRLQHFFPPTTTRLFIIDTAGSLLAKTSQKILYRFELLSRFSHPSWIERNSFFPPYFPSECR